LAAESFNNLETIFYVHEGEIKAMTVWILLITVYSRAAIGSEYIQITKIDEFETKQNCQEVGEAIVNENQSWRKMAPKWKFQCLAKEK
jgi:hypothetical protein